MADTELDENINNGIAAGEPTDASTNPANGLKVDKIEVYG